MPRKNSDVMKAYLARFVGKEPAELHSTKMKAEFVDVANKLLPGGHHWGEGVNSGGVGLLSGTSTWLGINWLNHRATCPYWEKLDSKVRAGLITHCKQHVSIRLKNSDKIAGVETFQSKDPHEMKPDELQYIIWFSTYMLIFDLTPSAARQGYTALLPGVAHDGNTFTVERVRRHFAATACYFDKTSGLASSYRQTNMDMFQRKYGTLTMDSCCRLVSDELSRWR